jgi:hypothetical protein
MKLRSPKLIKYSVSSRRLDGILIGCCMSAISSADRNDKSSVTLASNTELLSSGLTNDTIQPALAHGLPPLLYDCDTSTDKF